ncbi:alpha/beta fold hydrolase [Amorphus orientalis]|uniref:Pimeloyl-ACP methyl ester carboxylesterase n=1 Tax=Amorphus orientalis TaxID=649198 RepID=A0AAE4ARW8_9HYPH|nr:alpha/beta fold hydrolase [Amorphus orientalis]MDQ0315566.1 pimeloyl-ACP methyl ester carboxylesterase [Amorphus orientalis]
MMVPLVFIPGLACTELLFEPVVGEIGDRVTMQIVDHRGPDTMEAIVDQILANAPSYFALAGLSMGGYLAMELALRAPDRIERLALLNTKIRPDTPDERANREALIELAEAEGMEAVADRLMPRLLHPDRLADPDLVDRVRRMAVDTGADVFVAQERALLTREDISGRAGEIRMPTMVLVGDADQLTPPEMGQEIDAALPNSNLVTIEACGHLSSLERPTEVAQALATWLGLARI